MRVLIPFPSLRAHGGTRVAVEVANQLATRGHKVLFYVLKKDGDQRYWRWHSRVQVIYSKPSHYDVVFITSPHSIHLAEQGRTVMHLQMLEHMFAPDNDHWRNICEHMYRYDAPLFTISQWNQRELINTFGRKVENTHYIGNGVSEDDFPREITSKPAGPKIVLVEGWASYNQCKDTDRLAPRVAERLKQDGYKIVSYGLCPLTDFQHVPDEYHQCPKLRKINELYSQATILLKASRYDARSCSPVEAMTKGTPTARALVEGDDDLLDYYNCLRTPYDEQPLYEAATRLLEDDTLRQSLSNFGFTHLNNECSWPKWINLIEAKLKEVARK